MVQTVMVMVGDIGTDTETGTEQWTGSGGRAKGGRMGCIVRELEFVEGRW